MSGLVPRPWIESLEVYEGGKSKTDGVAKAVKLSSNESALGPSPKAMEAYAAAVHTLHRYPDASYATLKQTIADKYDLAAKRIVCGIGSDEILKLACRAYVAPGDEVIYSRYGFMMYPIATKSVGGVPVEAEDKNYTADVDKILASVTDKTRLVFLANPNNPTGTYIPVSEVERLHRELPDNVLLVLDAAYAEFVAAADYEAGIALASSAPNVLMTRTFSKLYGLAALRLGWGYASAEVAANLDRLRDPFNVPTPTELAGTAALQDLAFEQQAVAHNSHWLGWLSAEISALGLHVVPSVTNFILIRFPGGAKSAEAANEFLLKKGYILRWLPGQGLGDCLRLTVGVEEDNRAVVTLLKEFMDA